MSATHMLTSLYRGLLRAHRRLLPEMRSLGDAYVKSGMLPCSRRCWRGHSMLFGNTRIPTAQRRQQPSSHHGLSITVENVPGRVAARPQYRWFHGKEVGSSFIREGEHLKRPRIWYSSDHAFQMSPEQLGQLYELMHATKGVWKSVKTHQDEK
jgi:hypothetical protein